MQTLAYLQKKQYLCVMKLLDDYIFDEHLRYEGHKLVYSRDGEVYIFSGMTAAAVLATLLSVSDEGEKRGLVLDTPKGRKDFFVRYEKEVIIDNGGLFETEVQALSETYMEINGEVSILAQICRNDRLFDLAFGLVMDYMQYLVREKVREHIYDFYPYEGPFALWLLNAGYKETYRQRLLSIDWTDIPGVCAFAQELSADPSSLASNPTFCFVGLSFDQLLHGYWEWLWTSAQEDAAQYPDATVRLAEYKQEILDSELNYDDLKPEMKDLKPDQLNLFRSWMNQWTDFVQKQIEPPVNTRKKDIRQELLLDNIQSIPPERNYVKVREYILERCKYDPEFKKYFRAHKMTDFCHQLSLLFDWYVDPNHLGKRMKKKAKK